MTDINFKFYWANENDRPACFLPKRGNLSNDQFVLDDTTIPLSTITQIDAQDKHLVLTTFEDNNLPNSVSIYTSKANKLKFELGIRCSETWTNNHKKRLEEKGQGHLFRQEKCPVCTATIDLTYKEPTPQMSCEICNTISESPASNSTSKTETGYQLCNECGRYSKPQKFSIFYFVFLIVDISLEYRTTWRCLSCMRGEAWNMLAVNLIFILGVPVSLFQLLRSYGVTDINPLYKNLDKGNHRARRQKFNEAIAIYQKILLEHPISAGIKYNIGLVMSQQNRTEEAARMFECALTDCANYRPAALALADCYQTMNENDKLAALHEKWGDNAEDEIHEAHEIESE